jgi:glycosyltransferase involved in cell wall biosynthesis
MKLTAKYSIRKADKIIAVSKATADSLVTIMGIPDEKIVVIHNAADQYKPVAKEKASAYITEKYNITPNYILTLLTLEPRKNLELLLKVFSVLKVKKVNLRLAVAGASGWKDSYLRENYGRFNLTENEVKFLGYVPEEDIAYLYSGASVFLFPSRYEGFGIPPLEAMTCGTPVISTNVFSLPEVIGDAGILLDPDDIDGWVEAIIKVVSDETKREEMRRKGIERAKLFSWKIAAEKTLKVFESLY